MKAILILVAAVAILTNMAEATPNRNLLLERLIYGEESSPEKLERTEKNEKEVKMTSQNCCYPKSFESTIHTYEPGVSPPVEEKFYVDAANSRLAYTNGENREVTSCQCCSCTTTLIDEAQKRCRHYVETGVDFDDVFDLCVPPKATSLGTIRMGTDGRSSMVVQQWAYANGNEYVRRLATANGCFPVAEVMTRTSGSCQSELVDVHFFDVESPIKDTRIFAIPSYCHRDEQVEAVGDEEKPKRKPFYLRSFK